MATKDYHKPPDNGFVRFCPKCGRNDRIGNLRERHFAGGELCPGEIVTLEYALVNSEHQRLKDAVAETAKIWKRITHELATSFTEQSKSDSELTAMKREHVKAEVALGVATDALVEFEKLKT